MSTHANDQINMLIETNIDLIPQIVGSFIKNGIKEKSIKYMGILSYEEMASVVGLALVECAHKYNPEKAAFNSYVTTSAKLRIHKAEIEESKHINHKANVEGSELEFFIEQYSKEKPEETHKVVENLDSRRYLTEKLTPFFPETINVEKVVIMMENGYSQRKIARCLGVTPHTINSAVKRIRKMEQKKPDFFNDTYIERVAGNKISSEK